MKLEKVYKLIFGSIYPLYLKKVTSKNRTQEELDTVIKWLTGYDQQTLEQHIQHPIDLENFFDQAPLLHPNAVLITGMICGYRIEEIEEPLMRKIRYMDKLVDELAKGRKMEKILRTA